jgi:hypothetical protein
MDLIVDLAAGPGTKRRFQDQLFHTKPGGMLLCRIPRHGKLLSFIDEIQQLRTSNALEPPALGSPDRRPMGERDRHALAASIRRLEVHGGFVLASHDVDAHVVRLTGSAQDVRAAADRRLRRLFCRS